ncbi:response regulator [Alsobacter sp. R-9]
MPSESRTDGSILVVEDEVLIRLTVADFLRECGFQVFEAAHAGEAIRILDSEIPIDILFTDVQMPGDMDGFGLARWVRRNKPQIRVLLTSGLARAAAVATDLCDESLVPKPYDHGQLLRRLRAILAGN